MITVSAVTVRRARATVTRASKVINGLFELCRAATLAGAFSESAFAGANIEGRPMVACARRSIRIVTKEDETAGRCRSSLPVQRWRDVFSIASKSPRDFRSAWESS